MPVAPSIEVQNNSNQTCVGVRIDNGMCVFNCMTYPQKFSKAVILNGVVSRCDRPRRTTNKQTQDHILTDSSSTAFQDPSDYCLNFCPQHFYLPNSKARGIAQKEKRQETYQQRPILHRSCCTFAELMRADHVTFQNLAAH